MTLACRTCNAPVLWAKDCSPRKTWVKFDERPVRRGLRFKIHRRRNKPPLIGAVARWWFRGYRLHVEGP